MASVAAIPIEPIFNMDKLSYEIFSILETKFLFGYDDSPRLAPPPSSASGGGRVRILSIDAGGSTDGLLAAKSLCRLEQALRKKSGDAEARIADFFDIAAGSGTGGVLAAVLFTCGADGRPIFSADEALRFLSENRRKGIFGRLFRSKRERLFRRIFGDSTLKDTLKPLLVPCYDLSTGAPFVFSRADAVETDGFDFRVREVCEAAEGGRRRVVARSVDGRTEVMAVGGGGLAMGNPTAMAITHVLNNFHEFPLANGVDDLLVASIGNGESDGGRRRAEDFVRIAGDGVSDMVSLGSSLFEGNDENALAFMLIRLWTAMQVDQAVSMAFGHNRTSNYVRIQGNNVRGRPNSNSIKTESLLNAVEEMLTQKNVESIMFRGKKVAEKTNIEKLDWLACELVKEHERRMTCVDGLPVVVLKQGSPRSSSVTVSSSSSSSSSSS
ncbi:hypothetical protein QJS10_CPA09g01156 [Acorus calamus]|uniref:PNPLA domain-containing protein n=1 Tax=Acorus calamus TaxID=4465 RepID=A0AAV9E482_ACOCL|nr:hypothetical protein QJS10_CPA09g01156 [Acorus calamus]